LRVLGRKLKEYLGVGNGRFESFLDLDRFLDPAPFLDDLLRLLLVVPEVWLGDLFF